MSDNQVAIKVEGMNELLDLIKNLGKVEKAAEEIPKATSKWDKLSASMSKVSSGAGKATTTMAKSFAVIGTAALAAGTKVLDIGSEYREMEKSAVAFSKSPAKGKEAFEELNKLISNSGLEINDASRKMNAFLASGQDSKTAANLGMITTYLEKMSDEGGSAAGHLQDMAANVPLTATHFEDLKKGMGLSNEEFLKAIRYTGEFSNKAGEIDQIVKDFNTQFGGSKAALEALKKTDTFKKLAEDAKNSGTVMQKLGNAFNGAMANATKGIDFDALIKPIQDFLSDPANIKIFSDILKEIVALIKSIDFKAVAAGLKTFAEWIPTLFKIFKVFMMVVGAIWVIAKVVAFVGWLVSVGWVTIIIAAIIALVVLIIAYWDEIVSWFVGAGEKIKEIWNSILETVGSKINEWVNLGKKMVEGLIQGILGFKQKLLDVISGIATDAIDKFKSIFGIHSPSKEMAIIGQYNMEGLVNGQEDGSKDLTKSNEKIANNLIGDFSGGMNSGSTTNNKANVTINISGGSSDEIKAAIYDVFQQLNFQLGN